MGITYSFINIAKKQGFEEINALKSYVIERFILFHMNTTQKKHIPLAPKQKTIYTDKLNRI